MLVALVIRGISSQIAAAASTLTAIHALSLSALTKVDPRTNLPLVKSSFAVGSLEAEFPIGLIIRDQ